MTAADQGSRTLESRAIRSISDYVVGRKPLQPGAVRGPVRSAVSGDASVIEKPDAVSVCTSIEGQGRDLLFAQRSLESEPGRVGFVVNPVAACDAKRFISPVQNQVAPVLQSLQTEGHEYFSHLESHYENLPENRHSHGARRMGQDQKRSSTAKRIWLLLTGGRVGAIRPTEERRAAPDERRPEHLSVQGANGSNCGTWMGELDFEPLTGREAATLWLLLAVVFIGTIVWFGISIGFMAVKLGLV